MMRYVILGAALLILLATSVSAFDGQRKGFVIGGGAGFTPIASWKADIPFFTTTIPIDEQRPGFALQFVIGGAFDERNMLVYEGNIAAYKSDIADLSVVQGFNGAAWYHYFGRTGNSFFTTLGLGFYYARVEDFDANDPGGALLLGAGYEFTKHWQFALSVSSGRTKAGEVDFDHVNISLLITGIAF